MRQILIIEDDVQIAKMLSHTIREAGSDTRIVLNGQSALNQIGTGFVASFRELAMGIHFGLILSFVMIF